LLSTFVVNNTGDSAVIGSGSLRAAILAADGDTSPGTDNIVFAIPASTAPELNVPVAGFDPTTQNWTISPATPLPPLTRPISIDGYSQTNESYRYPSDITSAVQSVTLTGLASGGTFTLTTSAPLPVGTTVAIPYNATAATVQSALATLVGSANVSVTGGPVNTAIGVTISFQGSYSGVAIPNLAAASSLTGVNNPEALVQAVTVGGTLLAPTVITSVPNSTQALSGNNAIVRVIVDGIDVPPAPPSGPPDIGLEIAASNSIVRGLAIEGFDIGIQVDNSTDVGNLVQGNFLGKYVIYPVDPETGDPLLAPNNVVITTVGNREQGVAMASVNTTLGGTDPQDDNVIAGNNEQGVLLLPGATGNQVLGNQIGVIGPIDGLYYDVGNGDAGVLIASSGTASNPSSIVYTSSNVIGGAVAGAGNVISANATFGVEIAGVGATRNLVEANYIGVAPGGGYLFGTGDPGNSADGVWLNDAPDNQIGGPVTGDGNVIASNGQNGVDITGADAQGNGVLNNIIGLTSSGSSALGNHEAGVNDTAPGTIIGPGNVISANLVGVLITGASATGVTVAGNLIGTDITGEADLGNAQAGVDIEGATGTIIEGNGQGSQVISGNQVGVKINTAATTGTVVAGNYIGVDQAGTADRGNARQGVLIEGSAGNTIGGTTAAARNVISANLWGIWVDGPSAIDNSIEGNLIGTDSSGTKALGNEINGIVFSASASDNTVGGTASGQGNTIADNVAAGVLVNSGIGDSILSNNIYANGQRGVFLNGSANNAQTAPVLSGAVGGGTGSNIQGSLTSVPATTFLVQFFSNLVADPSGFGQGQTFLGSTTVTTDPVTGIASINANISSGLPVGTFVTAMATNESTGDTSAFSNAISAQAASVSFSMSGYTVASTAGTALIDVVRSGNLNVSVSVSYSTSNGSAVAGQDYVSASGILNFPVGATDATFPVTILENPERTTNFSTVNLALGQTVGGATLGAISAAALTITYPTGTGQEFVVTNTNDSGAGSLRQAILDANADTNTGVDHIVFSIPASTAANLNVPVSGFDPSTQTWTINLQSPLPQIEHSVSIDGYTQASFPVPFRYPNQVSSAVQMLLVNGMPTGGSFTLSTSAPLPVGVTPPIPFNATAAQVQAALETIVAPGGVSVTVGPVNTLGVTITFQGAYGQEAIPDLIANNSLLGGSSPSISVSTFTVGGVALFAPMEISSAPNATPAVTGNNAQIRVILNGSLIPSGPADIGVEIDATNTILRGLAIDGFGIGVLVPNSDDSGDLIQGNAIGEYLAYPVDSNTGVALPAPNTVELKGAGNTGSGVVLFGRNATVGGTDPQDSNVIGGNGAYGVLIEPGAAGNQVLGNQIGLAGPSTSGYYFEAGNGADGVAIVSMGTASDPADIVYASSNVIGGSGDAGNLISDNHGQGIHIIGVGATRNLIEGNNIGTAPGGGFVFGGGQPGNFANGVWIDDAPDNQVGGPTSDTGNVISSNSTNGVDISGADATGNVIENNKIGLTASGTAVLGNAAAGVADTAPGTVIGPGNVISANLIGVLISGASATGVTVVGNLIGTDLSGELDLGNAEAGVDIEGATGTIVEGDGAGSQVISGNLVGVKIVGPAASGSLVIGNFIGTDKAGTADRGNANEGVLIENTAGNTVGGTVAGARNVISANQWGIRLDGATSTDNRIEGNYIGTDSSGTKPLGNEIDGIIISTNASNNTIGGTSSGQGNTIDFNVAAGVSVQSGTGDSILSNSIFKNGHLGIDLVAPGDPPSGVTPNAPGVRSGPNNLQNYPVMVSAVGGPKGSAQATLTSLPSNEFLVQFFSSTVADPSGYGQGETFLGSKAVTTNAQGQASISFQPSGGLPSGAWITSTATNLNTGDTSEFSLGITATPVSVAFAASSITAMSTAGVATIEVVRSGNTSAPVSVQYATADGTAIAGTNYLAASGTLTFAAGVLAQSFNVTLLPSYVQTPYTTTVNLGLSAPTGGATLGTISSAVLTIDEVPVPPPPPPPPINEVAPRLTSESLIVSGRSITGLTLTFSTAMNSGRAQDLGNFGFFVFSEGYRYTPGASFTPFSSAIYQASTNTVTLTPSQPLPANKFFEVTVDGQASPLLNNGLTDAAGIQLVGSNGSVGTPFYINFALGNNLSYVDSGNNRVSLKLQKGGLMEIFISPLGVVEQLNLVATVPGRSILSGTVRRGPHGTGRAVLPPIGGSAGVAIRLRTPPFYFGIAPLIDSNTASPRSSRPNRLRR
jgi:hypothetical protein